MIVRRALGLAAVLAVLVSAPLVVTAEAAIPAPAAAATIDLAAQTPVATPGSPFVVRVRLTGVPEDGSIALALHQRVRSRSELEASTQGEGLRTTVFGTVVPLASLPVQSDGTRRLVLSLDPAAGGVRLAAAGVYPLELVAQDAARDELATLITHVIVPPSDDDTSPLLHVAVVARIGARPALQVDSSSALDREQLGDVAGLVGALREVGDVPLTLAVTPETLDALEASGEPGDPELVDALRQAAAGRAVLNRPYVDVTPDALAPQGLLDELVHQLERGRQRLEDALGQPPTGTTWLADPDLGGAGLAVLPTLGVRHVVVAPSQVAPLPDGLLDLSLAHRFSLSAPADDVRGPDPAPSDLDAIALDPVVLGRLDTEGSPALVASRVLTELAVIWFEQPGVERGVVLPIDADTDPATVRAILQGLSAGAVFQAGTLDELFAATSPLLDAGDNPVARPLAPGVTAPIAGDEAAAIRAARAALDTFRGMVGDDSPLPEPLDTQLLMGTATDLAPTARRAHVGEVVDAIDSVTAGVSGPVRFTLTLTARNGTIPLTLRNDSGVPLHVTVHLRSAKLDFADGTSIPLTLTQPSTRIDIKVQARASGAFPLDIEVTSPDGRRRLVMSRYTVRSTAVAGVGVVLSAGAGLFLIVWWARHWRRTRRSARLVATPADPAAS